MKTLIEQAISNHPYTTGITRKAVVTDITWNFEDGTFNVRTQFEIQHFVGVNAAKDLDRKMSLLLDNKQEYTIGVDAEGEPIKMGDYDIFVNRVIAGEPFVTVVKDGILFADSEGKINAKMGYIQ